MEWLIPNTIYVTLHGSQAYGLNNELSDTDVKGIVMPPPEVEHNLFSRFEQAENSPHLEAELAHLKNPKNPKFEAVLYSLRKFMILAANVNPNIAELLWTDISDQYIMTPTMEELLSKRDMFLSSKAKFTFSGYAFAQAAKIERHRKWIVMGDLKEPTREEYGLPVIRAKQLDEVFGFIKSEVERWNLSQFPMEEMDRSELKETLWEAMYAMNGLKVGWDNWPQAYEAGVVDKIAKEYDLKDEVVDLLNREREFKRAYEVYRSWINWKKNRNPARHELEVKSGYDTKHASHLVRLMRMGYEILTEHKVIVKRPDREEILAVKNGEWTYEQVMEFAKNMQTKLDETYKKTTLRKNVDFKAVNELYHSIYQRYYSSKG